MPLRWLELWDCFSYNLAVTQYAFLRPLDARVLLGDGQWYPGHYWCTVDVCASNPEEIDVTWAENHEWKAFHLLALTNGCFAAQPNNRILWQEPSPVLTPTPLPERPDYQLLTHQFSCENPGLDPAFWDWEQSQFAP